MKGFFKRLLNFKPPVKSDIKYVNLNELHNQDIVGFAKVLGKTLQAPNNEDLSQFRRLYVLDFQGDLLASKTKGLEREITTILNTARSGEEGDQVVIRLESPGGAAFAYGHAASQIDRLRRADIKTTVAVDRIAASGGYMMAAVADQIISAPLAVIGSIGVVAEVPNFHNILKRYGVDYKQYTAGDFKRTVSQFGEITEEGERKFEADLHRMHEIFKKHVSTYRPSLDIDEVATGEHWSALDAITHKLVDKIQTSEDFIHDKMKKGYIAIQVIHSPPKPSLLQVLSGEVSVLDTIFDMVVSKLHFYNVMLGK